MGWKEKWDEFKETLAHQEKGGEERKAMHGEMEHGAPKAPKTDKSTGSETLDD